MIEHRKHCPGCNAMRTFRGDVGSFDVNRYTVQLNCVECGHATTAALPRSDVEPQIRIYPR